VPHNPNKTPCAAPNCHNWAMHGQAYCRSHRNAELGAGGAGAPDGNLNALKTGRRAHPLPGDQLAAASNAILERPGELPERMAELTRLILSRVDDPILILVALRSLFAQLVEACAARAFERELDLALDGLPAHLRLLYRAQIDALSLQHDAEQRLWMLRDTQRHKKTDPGDNNHRNRDRHA
jgi:hypothetical protein